MAVAAVRGNLTSNGLLVALDDLKRGADFGDDEYLKVLDDDPPEVARRLLESVGLSLEDLPDA